MTETEQLQSHLAAMQAIVDRMAADWKPGDADRRQTLECVPYLNRIQDCEDEIERLTKYLHSICRHPDFEYETTTGPRKACYDFPPPEGEGWDINVDEGRDGWERFDYHEEQYWRRLKPELDIPPSRDDDVMDDWDAQREQMSDEELETCGGSE